MFDLVIENIKDLATPTGKSQKSGKAQGEISRLKNVSIGVSNGVIEFVGEKKIDGKIRVDASGKLVTPGLVDAHTHLVFGGWRQSEFPQKLAGVPYLDILKAGGGILSTVKATRAATKEELLEKSSGILEKMLQHGTTTCEAKSGYGLSTEDEIKQLNVVKVLQNSSKMTIVSTFLGAHAFPLEFKEDRDGFVKLLCEEMIPLVAKAGLAEFADVFTETAVFTIEQTRKIFEAAKKHGFKLKMHADEIDPIGGAELAAEFSAVSADHLIQASDKGISDMQKSETIAVLLPATSFYLDKPYARARDMIETGVSVAVASDFNPGSSPNYNLQFAMNLACLKYKMSPSEALTAVTLNAAAAISKAENFGSIEIGKKADFVVWAAPDLDYLFYRYGNNQADTVIKNGILI